MLYKTLNSLTALFSLVNGTFFLFVPAYSLSLMGTSTNNAGLMNTQIAGAIALGVAVINWQSRNAKSVETQKVIATGNLTMFILLVVVDFFSLRSGVINFTGWLFLAADFLLGFGYGFYLGFSKEKNG